MWWREGMVCQMDMEYINMANEKQKRQVPAWSTDFGSWFVVFQASICFGSSILILCQNDFCRTMLTNNQSETSRVFPCHITLPHANFPSKWGGAGGKNSDPSDHSHLQELPKLKIHLDLMNADSASKWLSLWASKHCVQITRSGSGFNDHILLLQQWSHFLGDIHAIAHNKNQLNYTKLTSPWQWTGPRLFPILHFSCPLSPQPTGCSHTSPWMRKVIIESIHFPIYVIHPWNPCTLSIYHIYIYIADVFFFGEMQATLEVPAKWIASMLCFKTLDAGWLTVRI